MFSILSTVWFSCMKNTLRCVHNLGSDNDKNIKVPVGIRNAHKASKYVK